MFELVQVDSSTYYINAPVRVGIVKYSDNECCLIDSGSEAFTAKRVIRHTEKLKLKITKIFLTHSHADHTGGASFIQEKTGCNVYANASEAASARYPRINTDYMAGAKTFHDLKVLPFYAQSVNCKQISEGDLPPCLKMIDLSGHSPDQTGYLTSSGVFFVADSVVSEATIEKYGITALYDIKKSLNTLEKLAVFKASLFVPSHAEPCEDIKPLVIANKKMIENICDIILDFIESPVSTEEIIKHLFDRFNTELTLGNLSSTGCTIKSYLTYLYEADKIVWKNEDNRILWEKNNAY